MNGLMKLPARIGTKLMRYAPIAKAVGKVSKNKPEILAVTGGVSVLVAFVWAIANAMKARETMDISAEKVEALEKMQAEQLSVADLTEEQKAEIVRRCGKDLRRARVEGVWQVTKMFLLPGGLLVVGLALIGGGHRILRKRNVVLASALKGTEEMFKFYRSNVVDAEGKDADLKYMRGVTGEQEIETVTKDENGREKKTKRKVPVVKDHSNPWRFEFSETWFESWEGDTERNIFFLKCAQDWWNHEFKRSGEVSMYEVLKYLRYNFDAAKDGMTGAQYREWMTFLRNYGWRMGCGGDDFIDFGLYRAINEPAMKRTTDVLFIEFNCDGNLENLSEWPYVQPGSKENHTNKYSKGAK